MSMPEDVLITGAAGRMGRLLMTRLPLLGWRVRGCDVTPGPGIIEADITDLAAMEQVCAGARAVIHLAATPNAKPGWEAVDRLNIHGTRTVLEAARRCDVGQFLFASSIHTVGGHPSDAALTPDLPTNPSGIYGVSKIAGEALLQVYAAHGGMACMSLRICSFRLRPETSRELKTWLSHDDCVTLFDRCLATPLAGFHMAWGVSSNSGLAVDDRTAARIGYRPVDNAADHASAIEPANRGWPFLGGPVNGND